MIIVTGGAGFIGSNLINSLNSSGCRDILLVDDMLGRHRWGTISDGSVVGYIDKEEWRASLEANATENEEIECVFHLGACSDTTETDKRYMMSTNFAYSRSVFDYCVRNNISLIYASSAAVYGKGTEFEEAPHCEQPLNIYGHSKLAFDQYVRSRLKDIDSLVVGLRYFNVYGPGEQHKGRMASVVWHLYTQMQLDETLRLFGASHGYDSGEQQRDFVYIDDVIKVTRWWAEQPPSNSGIYNCGTGISETFNAVAKAVLEWYGRGQIEYIDFPSDLEMAYQPYTRADLSRLRQIGYLGEFRPVADGVREYLNWLNS